MKKVGNRRVWLKWAVTAWIGTVSAGCGTLMYPERRGQPAGRLDWKVVLLNGIGLLFFFIPGVIAFAVDFINGTIYLPPDGVDCESQAQSAPHAARTLRKVSVSRHQLHPIGLQKIIAAETGKTISLEDGDYLSRPLDSIDEFWETAKRLKGHSLNQPVS